MAAALKLEHFKQAAVEIGALGEMTHCRLIDSRFINDHAGDLAEVAIAFADELSEGNKKKAVQAIGSLHIFSERLLTLLDRWASASPQNPSILESLLQWARMRSRRGVGANPFRFDESQR
jgi:hypothetical protein